MFLLTAALAVTGGASFAQQTDPEPAESGPSGGQEAVPAVEAEQSSRFGVLRRAQTASDRLSDPVVRLVERGSTREHGAAPGFARRAQVTRSGSAVYVLPARGWICLMAINEAARDGGGTCNRTDDAQRGRVLLIDWPSPGITRVVGIVPDGAGEVTLRGYEGGVERVAPVDNTYAFETGMTPKTIEWGDVSLSIPEGLGKG